MSSPKTIEEKAVTPNPEQMFAECSQKRVLGLLAAMLPPLKSVRELMVFFLYKRGLKLCVGKIGGSHILLIVTVDSSHLCTPTGWIMN